MATIRDALEDGWQPAASVRDFALLEADMQAPGEQREEAGGEPEQEAACVHAIAPKLFLSLHCCW